MKPLITLFLTIGIIILAFTQKDSMIHLIEEGESVAILISFLFVALLVFFPIMPYAVIAGVIGSVFGLWLGVSISLIGILLGTMLMFFMARFGFQEWVQKILQKYPKAKDYEHYFEKNAFLGILLLRIVPVIPSPLLNVLSGISNVRWITFFLATFLGKIPGVLIFTFAGSLFNNNRLLSIGIYGGYFIIIATITTLHLHRKKIQV